MIYTFLLGCFRMVSSSFLSGMKRLTFLIYLSISQKLNLLTSILRKELYKRNWDKNCKN